MPKHLQKSVQGYLSKLKLPSHSQQPLGNPKSTTSWILSGCKHPKTPSFAVNQKSSSTKSQHNDAATLSDIDQFLFENFSSLYRKKDDDDDEEEEEEEEEFDEGNNGESTMGFLFESPKFIDPPPEIHASQRFFVSSGTSSSILEDARGSGSSTYDDEGSTSNNANESTRSSTEIKGLPLPDESIAVLTYSHDPYDDFRQSMQEMIDARLHCNQLVDWDFMEELLFCYLKLNEKKSYKYILGAFVDLVVSLRQETAKVRSRSKSRKTPAAGDVRRRRKGV